MLAKIQLKRGRGFAEGRSSKKMPCQAVPRTADMYSYGKETIFAIADECRKCDGSCPLNQKCRYKTD